MKHEKISIKWKLFAYLFIFVALLLAIIWIFQTVYLDGFYKIIKTRELNSALENLRTVAMMKIWKTGRRFQRDINFVL